MSLDQKLQSAREMVGKQYNKPDPSRVDGFKKSLDKYEEPQEYLRQRGLSKKTIEYFNLGYDLDKNAISIPVYKDGELINIRYRFINPQEGERKYTQTAGCENWMYHDEGIEEGLEKRGVLIVEGEFDLMSAWQAGFKNVVSPSSGKDSYAPWIELIDPIPQVYIAYDNDAPGKKAAQKMADRIGIDKCFEVTYPDGYKDANEYFLEHTNEEFKELVREAEPFYRHKFKGLDFVIDSLRKGDEDTLEIDSIPYVKFEDDWMAVVSGDSNVGKTSYMMNVAAELADRDIPSLVLPFERGVKSVGKRFLQVYFQMRQQDFQHMDEDEWESARNECINLPMYFSMPKIEETEEVLKTAKRIFDIKVVIVDHLNYLVRSSSRNANVETSDTLQNFKRIAQENNIVFLLVHHINKPKGVAQVDRKPKKEDLKGTSALYQDPEAVIMLYAPEEGKIEVIIEKNKGEMGTKVFDFDAPTGVMELSTNQDISINTDDVDENNGLEDW